MISGLVTLLLFQLLGEVIALVLQLPVPGPVIGMVLLFIALLIRGHVPKSLEITAQGLLNHLAMMFIPAGTGIVAYLSLIRQEWLPIAVALVGSTVLTVAVTALTLKITSQPRSSNRTRKAVR